MVEREGQCSTQVEPSSTQENLANGEPIAPTQERVEDPQPHDQVALQEPNSSIRDASHDQDLAQSSSSSNDEAAPSDDQGQPSGQDGDSNDQDDQVIPPRCNEDIEARRRVRVARTMELHEHTLEKVIGDLRGKVSTQRQLASSYLHGGTEESV